MLQQTVPTTPSGNSAGSVDTNIDRMIRADIRRLKQRDHGIRKRLHDEYGLADREMNDVSIDARSGFDDEAYATLLKAWKAKHEPVTVQ